MKIHSCLALVLLLSSCSIIRDMHYFKDDAPIVSNYYKVRIKGSTFLTSSRYVSGYYDPGAVQAYFGEIGQPKKGLFPLAANPKEDCKKCSDSTETKELVLLLSTNSDAIANGISNLVKSKSVVNSLSLLANKDKIEELRSVNSEIKIVENDIKNLITAVDAQLNMDTSGSIDATKIKGKLKSLLKYELLDDSNGTLHDTFTELKDWYSDNKK